VWPGNDANPETGAFARYVAVKGDLQMHIPDNVSFEAASTVGVGIGSAGYGLYYVLNLQWPSSKGPDPDERKETILIYGGSTATGALAIQFGKL
jgi:NADPH:quinone reductase-like Zn-dependent oxidoreductase